MINIDQIHLNHLDQNRQDVVSFHPVFSKLTKREKDVLVYILKGYSSKVIGKHLNLSYRTVETHQQHLKCKLGVGNKQALLEYCHNYGL